jgi:hypothetical protein
MPSSHPDVCGQNVTSKATLRWNQNNRHALPTRFASGVKNIIAVASEKAAWAEHCLRQSCSGTCTKRL